MISRLLFIKYDSKKIQHRKTMRLNYKFVVQNNLLLVLFVYFNYSINLQKMYKQLYEMCISSIFYFL